MRRRCGLALLALVVWAAGVTAAFALVKVTWPWGLIGLVAIGGLYELTRRRDVVRVLIQWED